MAMEDGRLPEKGGRKTCLCTVGEKSGAFILKIPACHPFPNELRIFLLFNNMK